MSNRLDDMRGNWGFPTNVRFGVGRITELPDSCREVGMQRPLVVKSAPGERARLVSAPNNHCVLALGDYTQIRNLTCTGYNGIMAYGADHGCLRLGLEITPAMKSSKSWSTSSGVLDSSLSSILAG